MEGRLFCCWPSGVEGSRGLGRGFTLSWRPWHEGAELTHDSPVHASASWA